MGSLPGTGIDTSAPAEGVRKVVVGHQRNAGLWGWSSIETGPVGWVILP